MEKDDCRQTVGDTRSNRTEQESWSNRWCRASRALISPRPHYNQKCCEQTDPAATAAAAAAAAATDAAASAVATGAAAAAAAAAASGGSNWWPTVACSTQRGLVIGSLMLLIHRLV